MRGLDLGRRSVRALPPAEPPARQSPRRATDQISKNRNHRTEHRAADATAGDRDAAMHVALLARFMGDQVGFRKGIAMTRLPQARRQQGQNQHEPRE